MFILEEAIINWKSSLRKNQALEDGYIEELESHLRDEVDKNLSEGKDEEQAFSDAIEKIGEIENVGAEYYKSDTTNISKRPPWVAPKWIPMLYWNYLKVTMRNIKRYKGYSLINTVGMTVGLACVLIITMMIKYEMSYDNFHEKYDRIYRVYTETERNGGVFRMAPVMFPLAHYAQQEVPEIEEAVCLSQQYLLVSSDNEKFYQSLIYAGENIFNVFSFDFIEGDKNSSLQHPYNVVISEEIATRLFGDENPVGRFLKFQNNDTYLITGVFKDFPENSHKKLNIIASAKTLYNINYSRLDSWSNFGNDYTYLLLKENADPDIISQKLKKVLKRHTEEDTYSRYELPIQHLSEIHFSDLNYDFARITPKSYLYIFSIIAIFILTIGCINFINLSTARSAGRFREVGVRKVLGANRFNLIKQFMSEAFVLVSISFLLSLIIVLLLLDEVNNLLRMNLTTGLLTNPAFVINAVSVLAATAIAAGFYPALLLSKAKPALVLKNIISQRRKRFSLRGSLVVFQFAVSVFLIIGTLTMHQQTDYLLTKDLGFESDRIIVLEIYDNNILDNGLPLKNDLLNNPAVVSATFSNGTPASNTTNTTGFYAEGASENDEIRMQVLEVDYDFIKTYGLTITEGRFFQEDRPSDSSVCLINETALGKLGWTSIINKRIKNKWDDELVPVVGVIKDFHYSSLRSGISPVIFKLNTRGNRFLSVQLEHENISATMDIVSRVFSKHSPEYPFDYFFLNDGFARYYRAEQTTGKLLSILTFLAIVICGVGLFGLTAFSVEQRTKEVGIRKTLGASVTSIIYMLSKEFIMLVITANILIWPVAYYILNKWLDNYAYRIPFDLSVFAITLALSIIVTFLIVGYYTAKAALANPIKSLRYE